MKKYVLVGTGHRGTMAYLVPLTKHFQDCVKICGLYDINKKRAENANLKTAYPIEVFDDFDEMIKTVKPDTVIVTTIDAKHSDYIIRALELGCDVISEKPITTDGEKMNAIYAAEKKSGKKVQVTFNCRFMPNFMRVKELMLSGVIGTPYSAHYEWLLDTVHGADYFRRWHSQRKNSGSLLIHKSTHHFDLLNWFIDDEPVKVNAFGTRRFYGSEARKDHGERCTGCKYADSCEYYLDLKSDPHNQSIYVDCEDVDGYYRDKCIYSEDVDIEDTVCLNIKYKKGVVATYSLTAHSPYEGMRLAINGSEGRIVLETRAASGPYAGLASANIVIYNRLGEIVEIVPTGQNETLRKLPRFARNIGGGHGGSDMLLLDMLCRSIDDDPMNLLADSYAGAMSIGIGAAANISMAEDRAVNIKEIFDFI